MKEQKTIYGRMMIPPVVGDNAFIAIDDKPYRTSLVEAIHESSASRMIIETRNTIYTVLPDSSGRVIGPPIRTPGRFNLRRLIFHRQ